MENKNKKRILIVVLIVLILTNLATLGTFGYKKFSKHHHNNKEWNRENCKNPHDRIKQFVKRELELDEEQYKKFCELKERNIKHSEEIWVQINKLRDANQLEITSIKPDSLKLTALADSIGDYHKKMQLEMNNHFLDLKIILKPEQLAKFNQMMLNFGKRDWKNHGGDKENRDTCKYRKIERKK